jgi:hypothetical protein
VVGFHFCGRPSFIAGAAAVTPTTNSTDGDFAIVHRRPHQRWIPIVQRYFARYPFFFVFNEETALSGVVFL